MSEDINPVTGRPSRKNPYRDPMGKLDDAAFVPQQAVKEEPPKKEDVPKKKSHPDQKAVEKQKSSSIVPSLSESVDGVKKKSTFIWDKDTLEEVEKWLEQHPGHTITSMLYCGMKSLGIDVADHLLVPVRKRGRKPIKR